MLMKLLKHECKATGRVFLPLYVGLLVVAAVAGFAIQIDFPAVIPVLLVVLLWALYVSLVVVTVVLLVQRFYRNLLRDEGYLMFTLPVPPSLLIASKLIVTCVWCVLSVVVGAVAALLVGRSFLKVTVMIDLFEQFKAAYPYFSIPATLVFWVIAAGIAALAFAVIQVYFALAVGQLPVFGGHRLLFAFLAYLAISTAVNFIATGVAYVATPILLRNAGAFEAMIAASDPAFFAADEAMGTAMSEALSVAGGFTVAVFLFNLILAAAMFAGTTWILKRKLNLE